MHDLDAIVKRKNHSHTYTPECTNDGLIPQIPFIWQLSSFVRSVSVTTICYSYPYSTWDFMFFLQG